MITSEELDEKLKKLCLILFENQLQINYENPNIFTIHYYKGEDIVIRFKDTLITVKNRKHLKQNIFTTVFSLQDESNFNKQYITQLTVFNHMDYGLFNYIINNLFEAMKVPIENYEKINEILTMLIYTCEKQLFNKI